MLCTPTVPLRLRAAFWKHHPVADQDGRTLFDATLAFHAATGTELVKLTPAGNYQIAQRGGAAQWCGDPLGRRSFTHRCIQTPADWARHDFGPPLTSLEVSMVEAARQLRQALPPEVPVLASVFAPLTLAAMLVGPEQLRHHLDAAPQAVAGALDQLTHSAQLLIAAYAEVGVSGIYLACQHLSAAVLPTPDYARHQLLRWDLPVMDACARLPLNWLHLHGQQLLAHALPRNGCWQLHSEWHASNPSPQALHAAGAHPVALGLPLEMWRHPALLRHQLATLQAQLPQPAFWLTAPCVVPLEVPESDIAHWVQLTRQLNHEPDLL